MKNTILMTAIIMFIVSGTLFSADSSTFWGAEGAVYIDDNKGYEISSGFAPISYTPKLREDYGFTSIDGRDLGRDLGSGWGAVKSQVYIAHEIKIPFIYRPGTLSSVNNVLYMFN